MTPSLSLPSARSLSPHVPFHFMADNRPMVYEEDGKVIYRASSVGLPARCLAAARQGYDPLPPPDYLVAAADAGTSIEPVVKAMLRVEGYKVTGEQDEVDMEVLPGVYIRGHFDAGHAIDPEGKDRLLEVKSMSPRVFEEWMTWGFERFRTYAFQISSYMASRQAQAVYAAVNRETFDLDVRILTDYPIPISEIIDHVSQVEAFSAAGILPTCQGTKYRCPYDFICDQHEMRFEEIESGHEETLIDLGNQYSSILDLEADLKSRKSAIAADIQVALAGREDLEVPGFHFTYKGQTSKKLNTTRLRKALGDKVEEFYDTKTTNPFVRVYRKGST